MSIVYYTSKFMRLALTSQYVWARRKSTGHTAGCCQSGEHGPCDTPSTNTLPELCEPGLPHTRFNQLSKALYRLAQSQQTHLQQAYTMYGRRENENIFFNTAKYAIYLTYISRFFLTTLGRQPLFTSMHSCKCFWKLQYTRPINSCNFVNNSLIRVLEQS